MDDVNELKREIYLQSNFLKGLGINLQELNYDLEFCPETDDLYESLQKVRKLSEEINKIIDTMGAIKHMAEI